MPPRFLEATRNARIIVDEFPEKSRSYLFARAHLKIPVASTKISAISLHDRLRRLRRRRDDREAYVTRTESR